MTEPLSNLWKQQHDDADFSRPGICEERRSAFERVIARRNLIEFAAGGFVMVVAIAGTVGAVSVGLWDFAISGLALVVGLFLVMRHLWQKGRTERPTPELSCREHLRAQLVRQRDLLRQVPGWYLFPLVPGILALYASVAMRMMPIVGLGEALAGIALPFLATAAFFIFVGWLNLATARGLERKIARLDGEG